MSENTLRTASPNLAQSHECWQKLDQWSLDDPQSALPFSVRLAKENGWSRPFARRAIEEYKRFVFLSVVAGHVICPSEEVDQVWHMHLTFTVSYWNDLCGQILKRPLHHAPTKGGQAEHHKHVALYEQTLASYRHWFGEDPPADLWSATERRFADDLMERVSRRRYWVVPKPAPQLLASVTRGLERLSEFVSSNQWRSRQAIMWTGAIAITPLAAVWNPLDWRGEDFLALYAGLLGIVAIMGIAVRTILWPDEPEVSGELRYDEVACLQGNSKLAINAAIARLLASNSINSQYVGSSHLFSIAGDLPEDATTLEQAIYGSIKARTATTLARIQEDSESTADQIEASLFDRGWLASKDNYAIAARFVPFGLVTCLEIFGFVKLMLGINRNKPIGILAAFLFATLVLAFSFLHRSRASQPARRWLKEQRDGYAEFRKLSAKSDVKSHDVALATALFGAAVLTGTIAEPLLAAWKDNRSTGGGGGCGTAGCGGSGCGGGGCGGGGCGGCGGG